MKIRHNSILLIICLLIFNLVTGCSGCSKSGIREAASLNEKPSYRKEFHQRNNQRRTVVKMQKINGVYQIPVEIDGVEMFFILDTGAGLISISATEARFLYKQGKLEDKDFRGTSNFIDANGNITEGTIIVLKTVKIGNHTLSNVEASVVNNLVAPLLFGESALEKLGKISIDYEKNEISFEE
jgi:aspartyl protease family protein